MVVCISVLVRHLWPLRDTGQDVALGLVAAAAILWAVALGLFTMTGEQRDDEHLVVRPSVFGLMTSGTILLAVVAFVLAFVAAP